MKCLDSETFLTGTAEGKDRRVRFHDLLHTNVALRIEQGQNIRYIQHQLGHASIQTTLDRYGHLLKEVNTEQAKKLDTILGFVEQSGNSSASVRRLLENDKKQGVSNSLTPQNLW